MKKWMAYIVLMMTTVLPAMAQDDAEYRMEIGGGVGLAGYLGDFNENLTKDQQPMAAAVARYIFNPYEGLKLSAAYGKLKGTSADMKTYYPDYAEKPYEFDNGLIDLSLTYERNLIPYGTGQDYMGAKRLAPFVFGGLGLTYAKTNNSSDGKSSAFTANVPIGIGIKYKVADRLNIGVEWAMHFSLSDRLDGVKDPYYIVSGGAFKNTDCYSTVMVSLTFSFWERCRVCHNQDED